MYKRPRRKPYIGWFAAILAAALLGAGVYGVYKLIVGTPEIDRNAPHMPASDPNGVFAWEGGTLCINDTTLTCTDMKGTPPLWTTHLPEQGMKAARVGNLTTAWGGKYVLVLDATGTAKPIPALSGDVVLAAPGKNNYAVVTKESNQSLSLVVYNVNDGKPATQAITLPYESIMGMGFFGKDMSQLWILVLDTHGSQPQTKLTMYYPGKAMSGGITRTGEIGYTAVVTENFTYLVGTQSLTRWEHSDLKDSETRLVYGWNLQDWLMEPNGSVSFLFSPSSADSSGLLSTLWYVNTGGDEYRFAVPSGCFKAMLKDGGHICVAARNGVWSMADDGTGSHYYPLANPIESIPAVIPGKAFVMQYLHGNYLINMP